MGDNHTYSRSEISKILSEALEIQTQKNTTEEKEGLTENELLAIAEEVGINRDSLSLALINYNSQNGLSFDWLKGSSKIELTSAFEGELSEEEWDDLMQEIRIITGEIGENSSGKNYELRQTMNELGFRHISLTPKNGETKFHYISNWSAINLVSSIFLFVVMFAATLITLKSVGIPKNIFMLFAPLGGLLGIIFNRFIIKRVFEKEKSRSQKIIDAISSSMRKLKKQDIKIPEDVYSNNSEKVQNKKTKS